MKTVLVLDANNRSALAVTRSLGRHGVRIITTDETHSSLSGNSRFSYKYIQNPPPRTEEQAFLQFIRDICLSYEIDILMPMTELTSLLLLKNQHLIGRSLLPFSEIGSIEALANKCRLASFARKQDIPVPRSIEVSANTIPTRELSEWHYPLVIKPGLSWIKTDNGWLHSTVRIANNKVEAIDMIQSDSAFKYSNFLLQEYISGHGEGIFAIYNRGQPLAFFAHRRIREKPPDGGVSVFSESVDLNPVLVAYTKKILGQSNWHGVAMVEFRVDNEGNNFLMEVNTRFWGSLQLSIDSGLDFPKLLYQITIGENIEPIKDYTRGRKLRWLFGDLKWLYLVLTNKNNSLGQKLKAIIAFGTPTFRTSRFDIMRWSDLRPFIWELKSNASRLGNHLSIHKSVT